MLRSLVILAAAEMTSGALRAAAQLAQQQPAAQLALAPSQQASGQTPQNITALPAQVNLSLYQGDDFLLDLTVTNFDGTTADLTGMTATAQIRATPGSSAILASFTATVTGNVIHLHLAAADSAGLVSGVWDCQVASPVTTIAAGTVTVTNEVTRP